MTTTENDLRNAFRAGRELGAHNSYFDAPLNEDEWIAKHLDEEDAARKAIREVLEVLGGNGVPNNEWIKVRLTRAYNEYR